MDHSVNPPLEEQKCLVLPPVVRIGSGTPRAIEGSHNGGGGPGHSSSTVPLLKFGVGGDGRLHPGADYAIHRTHLAGHTSRPAATASSGLASGGASAIPSVRSR